MSVFNNMRIKMERRKIRRDCPKDTVILYQFDRGPKAPSISPFPIKVETYLRMTKIPYEANLEAIPSTKGKLPWMTYNGEEVADSQFCINYLKEKLGPSADMMKHLTDEQKAIAHAFQALAEDNLYWVIVQWRWKLGDCAKFIKKYHKVPSIALPVLRGILQDQTHSQGIGRHTREEVIFIGTRDLKALSTFLGSKPFLMGEQPCETDCAVFGQLCQLKFHAPDSPFDKLINEELTNLSDYCDRMRETYWPDWEDCLRKDETSSTNL